MILRGESTSLHTEQVKESYNLTRFIYNHLWKGQCYIKWEEPVPWPLPDTPICGGVYQEYSFNSKHIHFYLQDEVWHSLGWHITRPLSGKYICLNYFNQKRFFNRTTVRHIQDRKKCKLLFLLLFHNTKYYSSHIRHQVVRFLFFFSFLGFGLFCICFDSTCLNSYCQKSRWTD